MSVVRITFIMEYPDIIKMIWLIGHTKQLINVIILFLSMLSCLLPDTELVYLCSIWIIYI